MDLVLYLTNVNAESYFADINKLVLDFEAQDPEDLMQHWERELGSAQKPAQNPYSSISCDCLSLETTKMVVRDGKDAGGPHGK